MFKTVLSPDQRIIDVRECLTNNNPDITVGAIVEIFDADSDAMVVLHGAYMEDKTPLEAYQQMIRDCGKQYGLHQ